MLMSLNKSQSALFSLMVMILTIPSLVQASGWVAVESLNAGDMISNHIKGVPGISRPMVYAR